DAPASSGHSELLDPNTVLSPYLKSRAIFHCPADNFQNTLDNNKVNVRSYSMNSAVGTIFESSSAEGGTDPRPVGSAVGGGWLPGAYDGTQTTWLTYGKLSSFNRPGPANTWVIMDESPYSINDGSLAVSAVAKPGFTVLPDHPAGNHAGAAGMAFADGHSIVHKWKDPRTYAHSGLPGQGGQSGANPQTPDDPDCFYLAPITSAAR
ncbi:MAG: hypothetical protein ACREDS_07805, partial [Limisphaerales bacterium]